MSMLSWEDKNELLKYLGGLYQKEEFANRLRIVDIICEEEGKYMTSQLMDKINHIVSNMRYDLALIIKREYLNKNEHDWWKAYFSKQTYDMIKREALDTFISCLYI